MNEKQEVKSLMSDALSLRQSNRDQEAIEILQKVIEIDPTNATAWYRTAELLRMLDRYKESLAAAEKSIELDPKSAPSWDAKAEALRMLGRYEEAIIAAEKTIELDSKYASPWFSKAKSFLSLSKHSDSLSCFIQCLNLSKKTPELQNRAISQLHTHFHVPFLLRRSIAETPHLYLNPGFHRLILDVQNQCKEIDDSKITHLHLLDQDPLKALLLQGLVHFFLCDPIKAYEFFNKYDDEDDSNLLVQYYLIRSMIEYCEPHGEELSFALKKGDQRNYGFNDPIQRYYAGQLCLLSGRRDDAEKLFESSPNFLPAMYMRFFLLNEKKEIEKSASLAGEIIMKENPFRNEYLQNYPVDRYPYGFMPQQEHKILKQLSEENYWPLILHEIHCLEITEAIDSLHGWLDEYNKNHPAPFREARWWYRTVNEKYKDPSTWENRYTGWKATDALRVKIVEAVARINKQAVDDLKNDLRVLFPPHRFENNELDEHSIAHFLFENRPIDRTHEARIGNLGDLVSLGIASGAVSPDEAVFLMLYLSALASAVDVPNAVTFTVEKVIKTAASLSTEFSLKISAEFLGQLGKYFTKEIIASLKLRKLEDYDAFKSRLVEEVTSDLPSEGERD